MPRQMAATKRSAALVVMEGAFRARTPGTHVAVCYLVLNFISRMDFWVKEVKPSSIFHAHILSSDKITGVPGSAGGLLA